MLQVTPAALREAAVEVTEAGNRLRFDSPNVQRAMGLTGEGQSLSSGFYASRQAEHLLRQANGRMMRAVQDMHAACASLDSGLQAAADVYDAGEAEGALAFMFDGEGPPSGIDEGDYEKASDLYGGGEEGSGLPASLHNGVYIDGYQHRSEDAYRPSGYSEAYNEYLAQREERTTSPYGGMGGYVEAAEQRQERLEEPWVGVDHYEPPLAPGEEFDWIELDDPRDREAIIEEDRDYG